MKPHESLAVWRKSVDLTVDVYELTDKFPSSERFGLTSQIRRASVSISANIAEGASRRSPKDFMRFLAMAQGSASEMSCELYIAHRVGFVHEETFRRLDREIDEIGRMISGLRRHLNSRINAGK